MVNSSINWASIISLGLFVVSMVMALFAKPSKRKSYLINIILTLLRLISIISLTISISIFFQFWRLYPIIQLAMGLTMTGIILETLPRILSQCRKSLIGNQEINPKGNTDTKLFQSREE
tara:strand:+ start:258 stop:614 length:357 start_codon:yes stop_codon:yes gene_type:complete